MAGAKIKLALDFDKMLEAIQSAGGNIEKAAKLAADECAKVMADELTSECNASNVPQSVTNEIKSEVIVSGGGNVYEVEAGWGKGEYTPNNLSAAYKAIFLNYGTARRTTQKNKVHRQLDGEWKTFGTNRGAILSRGFIGRAKKGAQKKLKKVQREALDKMLKELT